MRCRMASNRVAAALALLTALSLPAGRSFAGEPFHAFLSPRDETPAFTSLTLDGLPPERPLASLTPPGTEAPQAPREEPRMHAAEPKRRFGAAAAEVVLLELIPWSFNRYITNSEFAHISTATVAHNFQTGFAYDRDAFK